MTTRKSRPTTVTTAAALSLFVLAATAAQASSPNHREPYSPMKKLRYLVDQVAEDARHVHQAAERRAHRRGYREEHALRLLHDLDECSRLFAQEVRRYNEPYRIRRDFEQLERSFNRAAEYMPTLHASRHVDDDFDELAESMYVLNDFVERTFYRAHRTRYDHRRWDRDWRYRDRQGRVRVVLPRIQVDLDWPW